MPFPTVPNDMLPPNMIAFTMPVKAGPEGNMQFRYDPKARNLYCDLNGEDSHGMPAQFDNVRINEKATDPQLRQIWEYSTTYRKMYDVEYAESIGEDVSDEGEGSPESEAFSQESALPVSEHVADVDRLPPEKPGVYGQGKPVATMSDDMFSASGEFFTKDMMVATTQRENDRMVIRTLKEVINQYLDPKEKILPIVATLVESNEDMYEKNFGGGDDEPAF